MSVPVIPSGNLFNCTFYSITVRRAIISARSKNTSFNAKQVFTAYGISELELEKTSERWRELDKAKTIGAVWQIETYRRRITIYKYPDIPSGNGFMDEWKFVSIVCLLKT